MAKRMAAQQRGLLYGLVASVFVIIGLAVLLVLQMGATNAAYLTFNPRSDDPEAVQADLDRTLRNLKDAGIEAPNIMAGTTQLIADLKKVQDQLKNLAADISGENAPAVQGAALATWAEQVHVKALATLDGRAKDMLEIIPAGQVPGTSAIRPQHFANAIELAEGHMRALVTHYEQLKNELEAARNQTVVAGQSLKTLEENHARTVAEIRSQNAERIAELTRQVEASQALATGFEREQQNVRQLLDETIADARKEQDRLRAEMLDMDSQIRKIMASRPRQATALFQVDGTVISIQPGSETAYINLGKGDGVFPNLTFTVFDPQELGRDEPEPKGYVRIVSVLSDSSEVRVINHKRASPIVKDDVLVNIAYDPQRKFHFALVGKLDINQDGRDDRAMVADMIRSFGGIVVDEATVETDYIIAGSDPLSGISGGDALTPQEQARFETLRRENEQMARAIELAQRVMIPVLNQNRFLSLVGVQPTATAQ